MKNTNNKKKAQGGLAPNSRIKKSMLQESNNKAQGATTDAPEEATSDIIITDRFLVTAPNSSQDFNRILKLVKDVELPKIIFVPSKKKQTTAKSEKSTCMLTLLGVVSKKENYNPYATIVKIARDGFKDNETIKINIADEKSDLPLTEFELGSLRIAAIDFGDLSIKREKSPYREIKIEFDYDIISINNQTL